MEFSRMMQSRRYVYFVIGIVVAITIVFIVYASAPGGARGIVLFNDIASIVFAFVAVYVFYWVWRLTEDRDSSKQVWRLIFYSLLVWTVSDITWAFYEVVLGKHIPFPSVADFFWMLGFIPFSIGLFQKYRTLNAKLDRRRVQLIAVGSAIFILIAFYFSFYSNGAAFSTRSLFENILMFSYPVMMLILLILASLVLFSIGKGRFALTWRLIVNSLFLRSASNLLIVLLAGTTADSSIDIYLDPIVMLTVVLYFLSYLLMALGGFAHILYLEAASSVELHDEISANPRNNILVFLDPQNRIITASDNLKNLIALQEDAQYKRMPFYQLLGIDTDEVAKLKDVLSNQGSISHYVLKMGSPIPRQVYFSAMSMSKATHQIDGVSVVLQAHLEAVDGSPVPSLTKEQKELVESFMEKINRRIDNDVKVLRSYFLEQIRVLHSLVFERNGANIASIFLQRLERKAEENKWQISINDEGIAIPDEYQGEVLIKYLSTLLKEAKSYATDVVGSSIVEREMERFDKELEQNALQIMGRAGVKM